MKFSSVLLLAGVAESKWHLDKCPDIKYVPRFSPELFSGDWYGIQHDKGDPFLIAGECHTQSYRMRTDGSGNMDFRYRVKYPLLFWQYVDVGGQLQDCQLGSETPDYTCRSTMNSFYDENDPEQVERRSRTKILDTDYTSYFISHRCSDDSWTGITTEYVTIFSRTPTVSDEWMEKVRARIAKDLPDYDLSNW